MSKAIAGLRGMNARDKQVRASAIDNSMMGNPLFPTPSPSMAEFGQAIAELTEAILAAEDRGLSALLRRNLADQRVSQMITRLAGYVNSVCSGDPQKIMSAGFKLAKQPEPISTIDAPKFAQARPSPMPRQLVLTWTTVPGAVMYVVQEATGGTWDAPEWSTVDMTSDHRMILDGRVKKDPYRFRIQAIGRRAKSPFKIFLYQVAA